MNEAKGTGPEPGKRVLLTGGGTGGHVYPSLAIYDLLKRAGIAGEALYLGVRGRAEEQIVPRHGIPLKFVPSAPFAETSLFSKLLALLVVFRGALVAGVRILRFRPALVVASGGYVSAPVILAAFLLKPFLRLRIVVDEQNLVPGLLNKFASLFADVVLISFTETAYFIWNNRCVATGYPVRAEYLAHDVDRSAAKRRLGMPEDAFVLLVTGGSMGARSINRAVARLAPALSEHPQLLIVHGIGMAQGSSYDALADTSKQLSETLRSRFDPETLTASEGDRVFYRGYAYLDNLFDYQKAADLVISRSGAGSLAEILALGRASILIPKRGLPGDHQEMNAISVAERGAAEVFFERRDPETKEDVIRDDLLGRMIRKLVSSPERLAEFERDARSEAELDVGRKIVDTVRKVLDRRPIDFVPQVSEPRSVRIQRQFDSLVSYLDRTRRETSREAVLLRRFYGIKLEEWLRSPSFLTVNKGIKLIGALAKEEHYPFLCERFPTFEGYLKRNALLALAKAERYHRSFEDVIRRGLADGYYETRVAAIALYRTFARELRAPADIEARILVLMGRKREAWEVRAEAIKASALFLDEQAFLGAMTRFRAARNVRAREAVLEAISNGLREDAFEDITSVRVFVKRMLITTSEFKPHFLVRARYVRVVEQLERMR